MTNLDTWNKVSQPPKDALKQIKGGRLSGMTDINPQWRYKAMTEQFGPCGVGWKIEPIREWTEMGSDGQVFAFVNLNIYTKTKSGSWSAPIPGTGGSMLIAKEKGGLYSSDEAFKMATTDALSVAMKFLGVAADIYMGRWDGKKYPTPEKIITESQAADIVALIDEVGANRQGFIEYFEIENIESLPAGRHKEAVNMLEAKR